MQFKRDMADAILAGKKTQTRRLGPPRYKAGSRQPVQCGYRDKAHGHIVIDVVRQQRLSDMSDEEAQAEGFPNYPAFMHYLHDINRKRCPDLNGGMIVTVYEFHLEVPS